MTTTHLCLFSEQFLLYSQSSTSIKDLDQTMYIDTEKRIFPLAVQRSYHYLYVTRIFTALFWLIVK